MCLPPTEPTSDFQHVAELVAGVFFKGMEKGMGEGRESKRRIERKSENSSVVCFTADCDKPQ